MTLTSLLVCADDDATLLVSRVLGELGIRFELCPDPVRAGVRLAQERFDLIVLDCPKQSHVVTLLEESRGSRANANSMAIVVISGQEKVREMFSLGVNFVLYKPLSYERAMSTLQAAQGVLLRDKRSKTRASVHAHARVDYADVESASATLVDLAENGMAVNFGKKLPPSSKVYFQFQLPGQKQTVRLSGVVVWQDWTGRAGVQFVDLPQASGRLIHEWLQKSLAGRSEELAEELVEVEHSVRPGKTSAAAEKRASGKSAEKSELVSQHEAKLHERKMLSRLRSDPDNRRGQKRYACRVGAEVYQLGSRVRNYCRLSDLSPGGCYLEMTFVFPTGTAVEVIVRTHEMKLRLRGEVKASHPGYGMGIAFNLNTKDERLSVLQLIDFVADEAEGAAAN
jgi:DNA-binding response OmpR family regulator